MITAEFNYQAPAKLEGVLELLGSDAEQPKVLGGGMTLVPMLNLGLAAPDLLIGLRAVRELKGVRDEAGFIVVGAMTTHHGVSTDPLVRQYAPLLAMAAAMIGDVQVRNRGTIGGSLAHADPAANYLPAVIALEAILELAGPSGRRNVLASDFFVDVMTTLLDDDEIVVSVRIPKANVERGFGFEKFTRVKGNFPIVCVASLIDVADGKGRLVVGGVTAVPVMIVVQAGGDDSEQRAAIAEAIRAAITEPLEDLNGDAEYKREMAVIYGLRALAAASPAVRGAGA